MSLMFVLLLVLALGALSFWLGRKRALGFVAAAGAEAGATVGAVHSRPQHLLISRKAANGEALTRLFNRGLATIRNNGVYERITKDATFSRAKP